jgi:hypothetical protein
MVRNFRRIAGDYTSECRKYSNYRALTDRIEKALSKGLKSVLSKNNEGSGAGEL